MKKGYIIFCLSCFIFALFIGITATMHFSNYKSHKGVLNSTSSNNLIVKYIIEPAKDLTKGPGPASK
jgi:hypothetical protein